MRDLWLGRSELDLDLVVEGDLAPFAERFAERLGSALHLPSAVPDGRARGARRRARRPGARPVGELRRSGDPASGRAGTRWRATSVRRDFTVNCLAIALAPDFGERLIDPCQGLEDLVAGATADAASGLVRGRPDADPARRRIRGPTRLRVRPGDLARGRTRRRPRRFRPALAGPPGRRAPAGPRPARERLRRAARLRDAGLAPGDRSEVRTAGAAARLHRSGALRRRETRARRGRASVRRGRAARESRNLLAGAPLSGARPRGRGSVAARPPTRPVGGRTASSSHAARREWGRRSPRCQRRRLPPAERRASRPREAHRRGAGGRGGAQPRAREWVRREYAELRRVRLAIGGRELMAAGRRCRTGAWPGPRADPGGEAGRADRRRRGARLRAPHPGRRGRARYRSSDGGALGESSGGDDAGEAVS